MIIYHLMSLSSNSTRPHTHTTIRMHTTNCRGQIDRGLFGIAKLMAKLDHPSIKCGWPSLGPNDLTIKVINNLEIAIRNKC